MEHKIKRKDGFLNFDKFNRNNLEQRIKFITTIKKQTNSISMKHKIKRKDGFLNFDNPSSIKTISSKESRLSITITINN